MQTPNSVETLMKEISPITSNDRWWVVYLTLRLLLRIVLSTTRSIHIYRSISISIMGRQSEIFSIENFIIGTIHLVSHASGTARSFPCALKYGYATIRFEKNLRSPVFEVVIQETPEPTCGVARFGS